MSTTITGTLQDSSGQLWTKAPIQLIFQPSPNVNGSSTWTGGAFNKMPAVIYSDPVTASFSITVPANNEIVPSSSYWQIIIGPFATSPAFVFNVSLITGSIDISTLFSTKASIGIIQSLFVPRAYNDNEVIVPPLGGQMYYDTTLKQLKLYENGVWNVVLSPGATGPTTFPPVGVATSTGSSWGASIDPTTLPRLNTANVFTSNQTINGSLILPSLLSKSPLATDATGHLIVGSFPAQVYPAVGIGVSTGSAWTTSIDPATVPRLNTVNIFTQPQTFNPYIQTGSALIMYTYSGTYYGSGLSALRTNDAANGLHLALSPGHTNSELDFGIDSVFNIDRSGVYKFWSGPDSGGGNNNAIITFDRLGNGNFNGSGTFGGYLKSFSNLAGTYTTSGGGGQTIAWNLSNSVGETDFINNHGGGTGGFYFYSAADNATITNSTVPALNLGPTGNAVFNGTVTAAGKITTNTGNIEAAASGAFISAGPITFANAAGTAGSPVARLMLAVNGQGGVSYSGQFVCTTWSGPTADSAGWNQDTMAIRHITSGSDGATGWLWRLNRQGTMAVNASLVSYGWSGSTPLAATACTVLGYTGDGTYLDGYASGGTRCTMAFRTGSANAANLLTHIQIDSNGDITLGQPGSGYVKVGNGDFQVNIGSGISCWQPLTCNVGLNVAGGSKNFIIDHPLDETKSLVHSCIEGPEIAVFYRGEVVTHDGRAVVTLPDYFEALTFTENRSVLLTVIVDDDAPIFGGQIAAGRIKDGKFTVYSVDASVTIAWEVKAIRRIGVDRLEVEPMRKPKEEVKPAIGE